MKRVKGFIGMFVSITLLLPVISNASTIIDYTNRNSLTLEIFDCERDKIFTLHSYIITKRDAMELERILEKAIVSHDCFNNPKALLHDVIESLYRAGILNRTFLHKINSLIGNNESTCKGLFIISNGYGKRFDLRLIPKIRIFKPLTFWNYFGFGSYMDRSKTIIIGLSSSYNKTLYGWQIGVMFGFIGLYLRITGSIFDKDHVFFIGYARRVIAFDLPDPTTNFSLTKI